MQCVSRRAREEPLWSLWVVDTGFFVRLGVVQLQLCKHTHVLGLCFCDHCGCFVCCFHCFCMVPCLAEDVCVR